MTDTTPDLARLSESDEIQKVRYGPFEVVVNPAMPEDLIGIVCDSGSKVFIRTRPKKSEDTT